MLVAVSLINLLDNFNTTNVNSFEGTFCFAYSFNQDLSHFIINKNLSINMSTMLFGAAEFNKSLNSWEKEDESSTMSNVESTHLMLCDTYAFNNNNEPLNWKLNNIKLYDSMFGTTRQNLLNYLLFLNPDADISNPYDNIDIALKHSTLKNLVIPGLDLKNITLKSRLFRQQLKLKILNQKSFLIMKDFMLVMTFATKNQIIQKICLHF